MHALLLHSLAAAACALPFTTATSIAHSSIIYSTVTGYFLQDEPTTNASTFNFTATNFGLINRTYPADSSKNDDITQWQRFANQISALQHEAPRSVQYKLLFMGRHGEGYHNAAEAFYGTPAWNCFYSILNGNETVQWSDAELTPKGVTQALAVNAFWATEIQTQKIPLPQSFYTSPLTRCLATASLTFDGLKLKHPFIPTVKEFFREGISGHTCDRRRSKTYIHENFPTYRFERGFSENDLLFQPLHQETKVDQDARSKSVLDDVFRHDRSTYISITSHSGEIASLLRVLGHQPFSLSTGAVIPVLVKAEFTRSKPPAVASEPYTGICTCTSPPAKTATSSECATATATVAPPGGEPTE